MTGSSTSIVGTDVCSDPAWKADCCRNVAKTPITTSRYGTGVVSTARTPSWVSRCITSLVSTATTPNNTPTARASNTARFHPMVRAATTTHAQTAAVQITATNADNVSDAS